MEKEVRARLHMSDDLQSSLERLAASHQRALNDEIVWALSQYVEREKRPVSENETDTLFSQGKLYPWIVSYEGERVATVMADTGGHACDYICQTRWLSRLKLSAVSMDAELV